jgi:hypothetical protein
MYFPLITKRSDTYDRRLYRRKGGGGGEGGGGGGGCRSGGSRSGGSSRGGGVKSGGSGGKSADGISPRKSSTSIISGTGGTSRRAIAYGAGGGPALIIPSGQLFAGRLAGGALRSQSYGNRSVLLLNFILVYFD